MNLLENAILFATSAHEGQMRKLGRIPYILHPMEVAAIVSTMSEDMETMTAAVLHDTVEDCGVTLQTIRERFGERVAELVRSETEDKRHDRPAEETWMKRKEESLLLLRDTPDREVKILWLSDKLANLRSFYRSYLKMGDGVWQGMHQRDPAIQGWYYRSVGEAVRTELSDTAAYAEYMQLVRAMFDRKA